MKIGEYRGGRHAPENSRASLVSSYVAGAGILEFSLQMTADAKLVLCHEGDALGMTGTQGRIADRTLEQLQLLDWSETFTPRHSPGFKYFTRDGRRLRIQTFSEVLEWLPEDVELLIEASHHSTQQASRREAFVDAVLSELRMHGQSRRAILYSGDPATVSLLKSKGADRVALRGWEKTEQDQMDLLQTTGADGLLTELESVFRNGDLTQFGRRLETFFGERALTVGAILGRFKDRQGFTKEEHFALQARPFVYALCTDSMLEARSMARSEMTMVSTNFGGTEIDLQNFAHGYAKANTYARVYQQDGMHVAIGPYNHPFPQPTSNPAEKRLQEIERNVMFAARDWPYYSGGGVGYLRGIRGDFSAETSYTVATVAQATTLEMAVLNVDPGAHVAEPSNSIRSKDSFYDPHGAPPYVGVEHDENDGFRINWNLGSEYDNNQYGRPVGDGEKARGATLRLDRRGPFFAAYYRDAITEAGAVLGPGDWVCVGAQRNDSMNPVVFVRCVGKRWRQEDENNPGKFMPVVPNHFTFKTLKITRHFPAT